MAASIVLALCVDRASGVGATIHRQWTQPQGSELIIGVLYTHLYPVLRSYEDGNCAWLCIHESTLESLSTVGVVDFLSSDPE